MMRFSNISLGGRLALGASLLALSAPVLADHSWSGYHWKRTATELRIPTGDNVGPAWDSYLNIAIGAWNKSTVINSPKVAGSVNPRNCPGVSGTIQVCNYAYGQTGWLGIASVSTSNGHIVQGTTKLNDTYFSTAQYNKPAWRQLVMCQELGHDYGLDHQDDDFNIDTTASCMDYTNYPAGNENPDGHDYAQLVTIYNHLESGATMTGGMSASTGAEVGDIPTGWGRAIHFTRDGRPDKFERIDGPARKTVTHVLWAQGEGPRNVRH